MKPTPEQLRELLRSISATRPEEIDCEGFLSGVAAYLETLERGAELPSELTAVAQHLDVCPECGEEFAALLVAHRNREDESS